MIMKNNFLITFEFILILSFISSGLLNCNSSSIMIKESKIYPIQGTTNNLDEYYHVELKKYDIFKERNYSNSKSEYYDYFYYYISIYNFGYSESVELDINLDEYCPPVATRYITLDRSFFHNIIGFFTLRLYNNTTFIIRCHY